MCMVEQNPPSTHYAYCAVCGGYLTVNNTFLCLPPYVLVQIFMVGIWKAFQVSYSSETSWRLSFIVPATIVLCVAIGQLFLADDCPKGNYKELEAHGAMTRKSSAVSFRKVRPIQKVLLLAMPTVETRVHPHFGHYCCSKIYVQQICVEFR